MYVCMYVGICVCSDTLSTCLSRMHARMLDGIPVKIVIILYYVIHADYGMGDRDYMLFQWSSWDE